MASELGLGLVSCVDLIDPLLEQGAEEPEPRLQEQLPKHRFHLEQRRGQILQQGVEHYLEFLGHRLV